MSSFPAPTAVIAATGLWNRRSSQVLGSGAATISFTSLTDKAYRVIASGSLSAAVALRMTLNNDTGANYDNQAAKTVTAGTATYVRTTGDASLKLGEGNLVANTGGWGIIAVIQKPVAGSKAPVVTESVIHTGAGATGGVPTIYGSRWNNTANLITRIDLTLSGAGNFNTGTAATVEGIA